MIIVDFCLRFIFFYELAINFRFFVILVDVWWYLVRGVSGEVLEGDWTPKRLVVLEFESIAKAKDWYNSPEYADLKKIRQSASNGKLIFADGA